MHHVKNPEPDKSPLKICVFSMTMSKITYYNIIFSVQNHFDIISQFPVQFSDVFFSACISVV